MKTGFTARLTLATATAALALGAAACEVEDDAESPGLEEPAPLDGGGVEGEGDL